MPIEVLEPGMLTTVQDLGRWGHQRLGMPTAGAMDQFALTAANRLVGNEPNAAGLEITMAGPSLRFTEPCYVALAGGDMAPRLDGREVENWTPHLVKAGTVLNFEGPRAGARTYLAVSGGIDVPPWLGSRSTYMLARVGGLEGRALKAGDELPIGRGGPGYGTVMGWRIPPERRPRYSKNPTVRVVLGPHKDRFTDAGINSLLSGEYAVTPSSNRMGYRLEGPKIEHTRGPDLFSCGIPFGGMQVPGAGQPIVLLADHQTVGGYTMIATVIQADIPLVAQCLPGDRLRFRSVTPGEGREALRRLMDGIGLSIATVEAELWRI